MTLQKAKEMSESHPFLRSWEAKKSLSVTVIGEPREVKTKFDLGENDISIFVDVKLDLPYSKADLEKLGLPKSEIDLRTKSSDRVWRINGTSLNFLIDKIGSDESKWIDEKIELITKEMLVQNKLIDVIFAKGCFA